MRLMTSKQAAALLTALKQLSWDILELELNAVIIQSSDVVFISRPD